MPNPVPALVERILKDYKSFSEDRKEGCFKEGYKDGQKVSPGDVEKSLLPSQEIAISQAKFALIDFREKVLTKKLNHRADIEYKKDQARRSEVDKVENLKKKLDAELVTEDKNSGKGSEEYGDLSKKIHEANTNLIGVKSRVDGRSLKIRMKRIYWALLVVLAFLEVPVNAAAFDLILSQGRLATYLAAFGVGAVLMIIAHFLGEDVRQIGFRKDQVRGYLIISLLMFLALCIILALAAVRQKLLEIFSSGSFNFDQIFEQGVGTTGSTGMFLGLGEEGAMLLVMNIAIFSIGFLIAFFRHDPHPDYEDFYNKVEDAKQKRRNFLIEANKKQDEIRAKYDKEIQECQNFAREKYSEINELEKEMNHLINQPHGEEMRVWEVLKMELLAYKGGYVEYCSDNKMSIPSSVEEDIQKKIDEMKSGLDDEWRKIEKKIAAEREKKIAIEVEDNN